VLRPAGLTTSSATASSVAFSWSGPATGPAPDSYLIIEDGQAVGSVPGTTTTYQAAGLAPATSYQFQVQAVRGGTRSPRSSVLTASTTVPPVSDAVLTGPFTAYSKVVRWSPLDTTYKAGDTFTDNWQFVPNCSSGPCSVTLNGAVNHHSFTTTLYRSGADYAGTVTLTDFEYCNYANVGTAYPIADRMEFRIAVSQGGVSDGKWTATAFAGTMVMHSPYTLAGNIHCNAYVAETTIRGAG